MKKIYIAGGGGMLGEGMYKIFKDSYNLKCTDIDTNQEWLDFLDFRNNKEYNNDIIYMYKFSFELFNNINL